MVLNMKGIGSVLVEHSEKARRLSIRVSPSGVRVVVPPGISLSRGREFLAVKKDWIRRHVSRIESLAREHTETARSARPISDLRSAREKILNRLSVLSEQHGLPYGRATVRNQKTRWGSCSARNNISLNIKLARLPEELLDYVVLHELVHTQIKGHGKKFWKKLDELTGKEALMLRRQLGRYSPAAL